MAEQSFQNHTHRPIHTAVAGFFALLALIMIVMQMMGRETRDWSILFAILAVFELAWISRVYTVRLQDRIIMLEEKVRAAEALPAGHDAFMRQLTSKQIAALRFASDEEFGALLERAARDHMAPRDIKAAIKVWRPDFNRT